MPKTDSEMDFYHDAVIEPYESETAIGNHAIESLDTDIFRQESFAEGTITNFQQDMFDSDSDKDITREHCLVVSPGGEVLVANRGDEHSCGFTADQVRDHYEGNYVVHNHPPIKRWKGEAGTFSGADIASMGHGEAGHIVSTPEGQYIMEFSADSDVEGFKKAMNDQKYKVNHALNDMRWKHVNEWYDRYKKGERGDETRTEAIRRAQDEQKVYWDKIVRETAEDYGIVYRYEKSEQRMIDKSLYEPNSWLRAERTAASKNTLRNTSTGCVSQGICSVDNSQYGYVLTTGGKYFMIPLDGTGEVISGRDAYTMRKRGKLVSWLALSRFVK